MRAEMWQAFPGKRKVVTDGVIRRKFQPLFALHQRPGEQTARPFGDLFHICGKPLAAALQMVQHNGIPDEGGLQMIRMDEQILPAVLRAGKGKPLAQGDNHRSFDPVDLLHRTAQFFAECAAERPLFPWGTRPFRTRGRRGKAHAVLFIDLQNPLLPQLVHRPIKQFWIFYTHFFHQPTRSHRLRRLLHKL